MVLLAGLPGSGKTTLAKRLQEQGWFWVNQDTMGNRKTCKKACIRALRDGLDVVIDRCNFDPEQRGVWVRLAAEMGDGPQGIFVHTIALHLDIAIGECIQRVVSRSNHPTLNGEEAIVTIRRFAADFRKLSRREGFGEIFRATNQHEIDNFAKVVLVDDDAFKAVAGEESNMVKIPCWDGSDSDDVIHLLVDTLLDVLGPLPADGDVRLHTEQISKALLAGSYEQQQEGGAEPNPEEINLPDDDQVEEAEAAGLPGGGGIALAVAA
ncbi:hypothetical protein WJX72_012089 [[Myrmecia] bisecta]|uniref:Uncharacterized protein n=1 Tax=[Myrmecia] bisecta TaxID=41462 RepID=A0AAW1PC82_9CHLO